MLTQERAEALADALVAWVKGAFPALRDNPDYTSIIHPRQYKRIAALVEDARAKGAQIIEINPAGESFDVEHGKMAPTLVLGATDEMDILHEEIFGPVLPIVTVDDLDAAIRYVNPARPLALYYFDRNRSGPSGCCGPPPPAVVNDTLSNAQEGCPMAGPAAWARLAGGLHLQPPRACSCKRLAGRSCSTRPTAHGRRRAAVHRL